MSNAWSKRRAAVAAEAEADARLVQDRAVQAQQACEAEKTDAELLAEHGLPNPDTLGAGDDFRQFLGEAIPARLKTRALRRLWSVNPVLANLDGLVDYGEDFTDAATVIDNLQSAYQVGKGMLAHVEALARQAEEASEPEPEVPETPEGCAAEDPLPCDYDTDPETVSAQSPDPSPLPEPAPALVQPYMHFTFDDQRAS